MAAFTCASGAAGLDSPAHTDAKERGPPSRRARLRLSALLLGCRRTPTPARVAKPGSVAPLTQLNPGNNYVFPKNKTQSLPPVPQLLFQWFSFASPWGQAFPTLIKSHRAGGGVGEGFVGARPWGIPALLPTQAVTNHFPCRKKQLLFTPSELDVKDGGSNS